MVVAGKPHKRLLMTKALSVRHFRQHVFFRMICEKEQNSFALIHGWAELSTHIWRQGDAGRTPYSSLLTLLPLLLTLPLPLTIAALLSLLPGERSHQKFIQFCPCYIEPPQADYIISNHYTLLPYLFSSLLIHAPRRFITSYTF